MLTIKKYPNPETWGDLLRRPGLDTDFLLSAVRNILNRVRASGDQALIEFNKQFDKAMTPSLCVSQEEIQEATSQISQPLQDAIRQAYRNIQTFHASQVNKELPVEVIEGVTCWRRASPIDTVGLYIPGGSAPLFSSVLMLGIPARLAGCKEIILCSPPQRNGSIHPAILYTANLIGISKIYKTGGAQAIAAMAYGTDSVPKVDKIFGPGNQYVTLAKQLVSLQGVAIDMPAGPSEVMILANGNSNATFIAADLLSQAEHGADSQVILISTHEDTLRQVNRELTSQLNQLPRKDIARACLKKSLAILVKNDEEMIAISNYYAPEHLIITTQNAETLADKVVNAGSVFIGEFTPEAAGDYASGTNHTLPTNGAAKAYSGVGLDSFMKQITYQHINEAGLRNLGPTVEIMAEAEQLLAHKNAISVRLNSLNNGIK